MSRVDQARRRATEWLAPLPEEWTPARVEDVFPLETDLAPPQELPAASEAPVRRAPRRPVSQVAPLETRGSAAELLPVPQVAPLEIRGPIAELPVPDTLGEGAGHRLVVNPQMPAASRERYRALAATLHKEQESSGMKVLMIASAQAGEGKTLTAANLALTLSESYHRRVLLVDADLRKPDLHVVLGVGNDEGLSDVLTSGGRETLPVRRVTAHLSLLTGGEAVADPMAALTSDRMRRLTQQARDTYDWIIIDTPPIGQLPDAGLVASLADSAIIIVRAEVTSFDVLSRSMDSIGRKKIVGVVLNGATVVPHLGGYTYPAPYGDEPATSG